MPKSLSLALYLATKARRDRATSREAGDKTLTQEEKIREAERDGVIRKARPKGPLVWFHSGQDAHANAIREFAQRLLSERDDLNLLLTTGADWRIDSTPDLTVQFAPDEKRPAIRRFLSHWMPDLTVWTEPDLRPALISEVSKRQIPQLLTDAGTARPDTQGWRWWRGMSGTLLSEFQHVVTGSADSAAALRKLGATADATEVRGYLEEGTPALPCVEADRAQLAQEIGGRPIWLAAQVSREERDVITAAHRQTERHAHRLLLILVPDDPDAGLTWTRELAAEGFSVALRSAEQDPHGQTQIYIADSPQEMGLWYRLAPVSFLGQSLAPLGGINPFGAAALGSAILHGPHVEAHAPAYLRLTRAEATLLVPDARALGDGLETMLSPDVAARMAHEAWAVCTAGADVTDRVIDLILTSLDDRETA